MRQEHPPLGKTFIHAFDLDDAAYPILAVMKDPHAGGYKLPAAGATDGLEPEFKTKYPNNKFVGTETVEETRVLWIYRRLPGPLLTGQEFDQQTGLVTPYTKQTTAPGEHLGEGNTQIGPVSTSNQQVTVSNSPLDALDAYHRVFPITDDFQLPNTLKSLALTWESSEGNGSYTETGNGDSTGTSARLSLSIQGSGEASGSLMPDLVPEIEEAWGRDVPVNEHNLFMPHNSAHQDILDRLSAYYTAKLGAATTVLMFPQFHPKRPHFTLKGQKISLSAKASASCMVSLSDSDVSEAVTEGAGSSQDISSMVTSKEFPPMLYGNITVTNPGTPSIAPLASAFAAISSGTNFPGASAGTASWSGSGVSGGIFPTGVTATSPAAIPSSGYYAYGFRGQNSQWPERAMFIVRVVRGADL